MPIFDSIKNEISVEDVCKMLGLEVKNGYIFCPFHKEKTPSCKIYKDNYYCFSCGRGGDAIHLVANVEAVRQIEAVKMIDSHFKLGLIEGDRNYKHKKSEKATKHDRYKTWWDDALEMLSELLRNNMVLPKDEVLLDSVFSDILSLEPQEAFEKYNVVLKYFWGVHFAERSKQNV